MLSEFKPIVNGLAAIVCVGRLFLQVTEQERRGENGRKIDNNLRYRKEIKTTKGRQEIKKEQLIK